MANISCFSFCVRKKKNYKQGEVEQINQATLKKSAKTLQINLHHPMKPFETDEMKATAFEVAVPFFVEKNSKLNVKVSSHESPIEEAAEVAYEGEDELEENSIKRDFSDLNLQVQGKYEEEFDSGNNILDEIVGQDVERDPAMIQSGHLSDPGIGKTQFWDSPRLKRSCSNLETRDMFRNVVHDLPPPSKSQSFEDLQQIAQGVKKYVDPGSPGSILTRHSADRVMLKKHSSSQILPSRSRRLWWKLFLWSHRNLHQPWITKTQPPPMNVAFNQQGGYCSDTLEPKQNMGLNKIGSPGTFTEDSCHNNNMNDNQNWNGCHNGVSGFWPQNQWVAFSTESSSLERVNEWVKDLQTQPTLSVDEENISPTLPQVGRSPDRATTHLSRRPGADTNLSEEILYANNVVQSLNTSSTVAHISGMGLRAIPIISHFSSLRSVNLSGNFIVHIPPGSLPKGLHTLNLARNKINTIEGLRELTRLRILDLSYNRISRIGHGLSNCTVIKELYLAANKISDVEGLHRLLKLTVLDLSFNKITTTKGLGQLVANYNSLLALNLLGNPIQNNVSDDQLRKSVCSLLPNLVYLNKQPIKAQRAHEGRINGVSKAALGNTRWSSRRKSSKKVSQGGSCSTSGHRSTTTVGQNVKHKSKGQTHHHLTPRTPLSAFASSSH